MRIYEYDEREIDELLPFRNTIFGRISRDHWFAMNNTGVVAREGDELVGFIPLQYREQMVNAQVSIPVVYENAVEVAEGRRGQGIGTLMIDKAARFMSDRVDALLVIRGGERTDGYRFYRKSGHSDLMYGCLYTLDPEVAWPAADRHGQAADGCETQVVDRALAVVDRKRWLTLEPQLLSLYERQYGRFGGGQRRKPGYWRRILDGHLYAARRWWLVVSTNDAGRLIGYLAAAQGYWSSDSAVCVYEVVGEDEATVERLLRYVRSFAAGSQDAAGVGGQYLVPLVSLGNPIRPLLRWMGFTEGESTSHVMARVLRPDRIFRRLAEDSDLLDTLALTVATPHRVLEVNGLAEPRYRVHLETKEGMFARLFCCRLDLDAALDMELVRWRDPDPGLRRELCQAFALCEWVQWYTDYV